MFIMLHKTSKQVDCELWESTYSLSILLCYKNIYYLFLLKRFFANIHTTIILLNIIDILPYTIYMK